MSGIVHAFWMRVVNGVVIIPDDSRNIMEGRDVHAFFTSSVSKSCFITARTNFDYHT